MSQPSLPANSMVQPQSGVVQGQPRIWLGLEAVAVLSLAIAAYANARESWWLFAALFFLPDISILGYVLSPRIGSASYNALHNYLLPILLGVLLHSADRSISIPLIWIAHIGFDRTIGYGLKYNAGFGFTHLHRFGKLPPHSS